MTIAYFDCSAGAAGDMIVSALLDAGVDFSALKNHLATLGAGGYKLRSEKVLRAGIAATKFSVDLSGDQPGYRNLEDILAMIDAADLPGLATERAKRIFTRLGKAEAKVHGIDLQQVHFHEIGATDSIIDIVGACVALELLGVEEVFCSSIPPGSGTFRCDHGAMSAPAPATAELLVGAKLAETEIAGEATTPTAAAVLTELACRFGPAPAMILAAVGTGAGSRDTPDLANVVRVFVGEPSDAGQVDEVIELSANVDDCTGEVIGSAIEKLLTAGCLDAWAAPIYMKKSRPAWCVSAICREADVARAEEILFLETTTFGIRRRAMTRSKLLREYATVETAYGPIRIKLGRRQGQLLTASPEFADCRDAGESHGVPVKEVLAAAQEAWRHKEKR